MAFAALRPLRHRSFALIWTGGFLSNVGTWMQTVAVGALITDQTGNPVWTAASFVAGFVPNGVLSPVGGALADRLDRRRFCIASAATEASIAAALAVLVAAGRTGPLLITALVFLGGCVSALRLPFQQAMLPDLVPRAEIVGAISLGSAQWNLGRVIGPALAGAVIVLGSYATAFAVNALSFLAVIGAFILVKVASPERAGEPPSILSHMWSGARAVWGDPGCRSSLVLIGAAAGLAAPFIALVPAVADGLVNGGPKALAAASGALTTAQGVGAVVGALVFPTLVERFGRRRMVVAALVASSLSLLPYALAPTVAWAVAALAVVGACYICVLSGLAAIMQLRAPEAFRGRAISLFFATLSVVFPIGALAQGALADRVGLAATTAGGGIALLAVLGAVALLRPAYLAALDDPPPPPGQPGGVDYGARSTGDGAVVRSGES